MTTFSQSTSHSSDYFKNLFRQSKLNSFFIVLNAFLTYWRPIQLSLDFQRQGLKYNIGRKGFLRDLAHSQSTNALIQHKKWYEKRFWVRDLIHLHVRELNHVHSIGS